MEVTRHIATFRSALSKEECSAVANALEASGRWEKSRTGNNLDTNYRSNKQVHLTQLANYDPATYKVFDDMIFHALTKAVTEYQRAYASHSFVLSDEGYSVLRYEEAEEYKVHSDSGPENKRLVSALLYLNDSFTGGETNFPLQNFKVKPETGMICLFPSIFTHPHASLPVESGVKYVVVTWYRGFP